MPSTNYSLTAVSDDDAPEMSSPVDVATETGRTMLHTELDAALDMPAATIAIRREPVTVATAVNDLGVGLWEALKPAVRGISPLTSSASFDVTEFFPINVLGGSTPPSPHATGFPNIRNVTLTVTIEPDEE